VTREILSLPLHPELAEHEIDYIIQSVREFF
jgi:dTDP-4-amino-4,6-dideoxygalactose transaminase